MDRHFMDYDLGVIESSNFSISMETEIVPFEQDVLIKESFFGLGGLSLARKSEVKDRKSFSERISIS